MAGAISGIGGFRDIGNPNDPRRKTGPRPIVPGTTNEQLAAELLTALAERDREAEAPASLYPQRMSIDDRDLAESVQNLSKYGMPRERDVRPETKKVLRLEGVDPESQFRLGQRIDEIYTPEINAYGGVQIPVRGKDGQARSAKTIYSNKESYEEAPSLAEEAKQLRGEYKTPLTNITTLKRLAEEGRFVRENGDGTYFGYIIDGVDKNTGELVKRNVYAPEELAEEGLFRVGNAQNRDYDAIRSELKTIDPRFQSGIAEDMRHRKKPLIERDSQSQYPASLYPARTDLAVQNARKFEETGLIPFLEDKKIRSNIGGLRRNYEGRALRDEESEYPASVYPAKTESGYKMSEMGKKYGMPFNELLEELTYGSFMDKPTVVNAFRSLEANDPDIERRIMSLKMAAERTTIPEKAAALGRAAANLETGIALVRAERTGREVDIQAFTPDWDPEPGITDVAAEIAEMATPEYVDSDYDSTGEDVVERRGGNSGFSIERARAVPAGTRDAVAMSGPVETGFDPNVVLGRDRNFSGADVAALRAKYQNPAVAGIARATSQPETDIPDPLTIYRETGMQPMDAASGMRQRENIAEFVRQNAVADRIQQAFDERLALIGQKQREQVAPDTGTAMNAPASTGSVAEQQAILDSMPSGARQNIERGLAEGASPASRQGALEFLTRFRSKMFR